MTELHSVGNAPISLGDQPETTGITLSQAKKQGLLSASKRDYKIPSQEKDSPKLPRLTPAVLSKARVL